MIRFLAVLVVSGWLASNTAVAQWGPGSVTIDNFKKTNIGGDFYKIEYSGTFKKLKDNKDGSEKWKAVSFKVEQPGKSETVNVVYVTPPNFTADGSYSVYSIVQKTKTANWTAYVSADAYLTPTETLMVTEKKDFTVP